ncbi:MAG: S1C family serine protease [Candidatus Dormibacteria bacterium]
MSTPSGLSRLPRLLILLTIVAVAFGLSFLVTQSHEQSAASPATLPSVTAMATPSPAPGDIARANISRVVTVEALLAASESLGTGWLVDDRGDFVTNAHVVAGQTGVRLRDRDGHTHLATILGVDSTEDVALLRSADGFSGAALTVAPQQPLATPQPVVLIAAGGATGHADTTEESLNRTGVDVPVQGNPDLDPGTPQTTKVYRNMLQLEGARVYQGNSGGPVLNARGQVMGILTLASKGGDTAFAIPIWRVLDEIHMWASH